MRLSGRVRGGVGEAWGRRGAGVRGWRGLAESRLHMLFSLGLQLLLVLLHAQPNRRQLRLQLSDEGLAMCSRLRQRLDLFGLLPVGRSQLLELRGAITGALQVAALCLLCELVHLRARSTRSREIPRAHLPCVPAAPRRASWRSLCIRLSAAPSSCRERTLSSIRKRFDIFSSEDSNRSSEFELGV